MADKLTFGGPKAFITKIFFPSNVGLKTMNSLDFEAALSKNLGQINKLLNLSDEQLVTAVQGLLKPSTFTTLK